MNRRKVIASLLAVAAIAIGCAKPSDGTPPAQKFKTLEVHVYVGAKRPAQTFTADLRLEDSVTGELIPHAITGEPSQIKVTRTVKEWTGTFTYWNNPNPVRLRAVVTWTAEGELLGTEVLDNKKLIPQASRFDDSGRIVILYVTSGA